MDVPARTAAGDVVADKAAWDRSGSGVCRCGRATAAMVVAPLDMAAQDARGCRGVAVGGRWRGILR